MKPVLSFGEVLIDFHALSPHDLNTAPAFAPHAGGAPANVAVAVAHLGGASAFVGMLARDMFGELLLHRLHTAGVDTRYVARTAAANTALAFVSHDAAGERSFSFYRPPAADLLFCEDDFDDAAFVDCGYFHACSNSLTEAAIAEATLAGMLRARAAGALVSFDLNLRPALWALGDDPAPRVWRALALADVVKLSAEELHFLAATLGGETPVIERLWQHHAQLVLVTDGAKPLRWFTRTDQGSVPAFAVKVIDSTAAGDAFMGGLLFALARADVGLVDLPAMLARPALREVPLRFACACGALAVTRAGAFAAMPTLVEVNALLESPA